MTESFPFSRPVLAVALVLALAGCTPNLTDKEHLARAREYQAKGDLRASVIELKSALQINPDNAEARTLLGRLHLEAGNGSAAEKELRRALKLGVPREEVMLPLAEALALQNKYQAMLDEIDDGLDLPGPQRARLVAWRGEAWLGLGKFTKAEAEFKRAVEIAPDSPLAKLGLAKLAFAARDYQTAARLVAEGLQADPREGRLWRLKAALEKVKGNFEEAEKAYTKAFQYNIVNLPDLASRALMRMNLKKWDEATQDVQLLKQRAPRHFLSHFVAGRLALLLKDYKQAQEELEQALAINDQFPQAHYFLGLACLMEGEPAQAEVHLTRFVSMQPNSFRGRQALAMAQVQLGDAADARETLMPVYLFLPEDLLTLQLMSRIELKAGHREKGLKLLEKMVSLRPELVQGRARYGVELLGSGKAAEGIRELEKALELDPTALPVKTRLVLAYIQAGRFDRAGKLIGQLQQALPESSLAGNLRGALEIAKGEIEAAKTIFTELLVEHPDSPAVIHNLAQLLIKEKNYSKARALYERILRKHPKHFETQMRLAELDALESRGETLLERLQTLSADYPEALKPRLALARFHTKRGDTGRALRILEEVGGRYRHEPAYLRGLAEVQMAAGMNERALSTLAKLIERVPGDSQGWFMKARIHGMKGEMHQARSSLEKAIGSNPDFMPAQIALVKLTHAQGEGEKARQALRALQQAHPDNADLAALQGWLLMHEYRPEKAVTAYRRALTLSPQAGYVIDLAKAYWAAGRKEEAKRSLKGWLTDHPRDTLVRLALAAIFRTLGEEEQAIAQLEAVLEYDRRNIPALNDLAVMLTPKDPERAAPLARKAATLAPDVPAIQDTLAVVLMEQGELREAGDILEPLSKRTTDPSIRFHWADLLVRLGRNDQALPLLETLIEGGNDFPERDRAQRLLEEIRGGGKEQ